MQTTFTDFGQQQPPVSYGPHDTAGMKVMSAKFPGKCRHCHGRIRIGDQIAWSRERGAQHNPTCPPPDPANAARSYRERPADGLEPGMYKIGDTIYLVKYTARTKRLMSQAAKRNMTVPKDQQRLVASRLIFFTGTRLNSEDDVVNFEFEYDKGAIFSIEPKHRMSFDEAQALTLKYGRCIICRTKLKAAKSVQRGIGPVCRKYFPNAGQYAAA